MKIIDYIIGLLNNSETEDIFIPRILANVLYHYDRNDEFLFYEWLSDNYVTCFIPSIIQNITCTQKYLIQNNHTLENKGGHGSGDSYVYYIPDKNKIVQCYEGQNLQFIVIYYKNLYSTELHIRRFWDDINKVEKDDYRLMDLPKSSKVTLKELLKHADYLTNSFSDNVLDNKYIKRPTLQMFVDILSNFPSSKFPLGYRDSRDPGYILSLNSINSISEKVDCTIHTIGLIKRAFFDINSQIFYFKEKLMG